MNTLEDQAVLLLYAFTVLIWAEADVLFVTGFLCSIIYIALNNSFGRKGFSEISALAWTAVSLWYPSFFYFFPVVFYTLLHRNVFAGIFLLLFSTLYIGKTVSMAWLLFLIPGCAAAFLLWRKTVLYYRLDSQYRRTQDDSKELTLLLKEKNRTLLKNQDYEIYTATLKDRNRIAREIHDHVGHMLSCCILMTGAMKTTNTDSALSLSLNQLEITLNAAMDNIRQSVHDLHDESVNLKDTLERLAASHTTCSVSLEYDMDSEVPVNVKYCLIAIIKEGLHNIARHSDADNAWIVLREHPALYQLSIRDNGTPKKQPAQPGLGLENMRERAHFLGGTMQIYMEKGFQIFITLPKQIERKRNSSDTFAVTRELP